ncbi:MAG: acyl carrier protein [Proteobacteria bacterium]|nr:acyl carrier protein [Pseudomonadota bacterium]
MTAPDMRAQVLACIKAIAPEFEASDLRTGRPLRDQVDLDSMDWVNFFAALGERLHMDIPEPDYAKLVTLEDLVAYLETRPRRTS